MSIHLDAFVLGVPQEELDPALSNLHHQPADQPTCLTTESVVQDQTVGVVINRRICTNCQATNSSYWRKDGEGRVLCNACGLFLRTHGRHRPLLLQRNREARRGRQRPPNCGNCGTDDTPLWRRVNGNETVCNACGLYFRLHGHHRPPPTACVGETTKSVAKSSEFLAPGNPIFIQEFQLVDPNDILGNPQQQQQQQQPCPSVSPHRSDPPIVAGNVWHAYEPKTAAGGAGKFVTVSGYGTQVRLRRPSFDPSVEYEAALGMTSRSLA